MDTRAVLALLVTLVVTASGCTASSVEQQALEYLAVQLPEQDLSGHILILSAAVAVGEDIHAWPSDDFSVAAGLDNPDGLGDQARLLLALATADGPSDDLQGLQDAVWGAFDGHQFGSEDNLVDDAFAVAALMAAGESTDDARIQTVVSNLRHNQTLDGGWTWNGKQSQPDTAPTGDTTIQGEPDETAFVLRALSMAEALDDGTQARAVSYLEGTMHTDGSYDYGGTVNCQTSGLALLAWSYVAVEAPEATREYVLSCQNDDGGFPYLKGGPSQVWATVDVLQGLVAA